MLKSILTSAAIVALLAGCATSSVSVGPAGTAAVTVPSAMAGLATLTDADLKAAEAELVKANGGMVPTTVPLVDDYQCIAWLDSELPAILAAAGAAVPASTPSGVVSAFIAAKIAATQGEATAANFQSALVPEFAHYCGAAFMADETAIVNALAQVGIKVAVPALP